MTSEKLHNRPPRFIVLHSHSAEETLAREVSKLPEVTREGVPPETRTQAIRL